MRFGVRIGAFVALGLTACTLLYGPSDAEFSGGSPDAGHLADGAPVSTSSTSSSGGGEGGTHPNSDASTEAGAPFMCPTGALLCDDFESGTSDPFTSSDGPIETVAGGEGGSANALAATVEQGQDVPQVDANFTVSVAAATLDFWFKLDSAVPVDEHFRLASMLWGADCDWQLSTTAYMTEEGLVIDLSSYDHATNPSCGPVDFQSKDPAVASNLVVDGNWHHVVMLADARTSHVSVTATIDAEAPFTLSLDLNRTDTPGSVALAIGIPCIQTDSGCFDYSGPSWRVLFDNVTFVSL